MEGLPVVRYANIPSPLGELLVVRDDVSEALTGLYLPTGRHASARRPEWEQAEDAFDDVRGQLTEYFAGDRRMFDLALAPRGTPFQHRVWSALAEIPSGRTTSYGVLAAELGSPAAARAVGLANGRNPISIIVPCHRVVGSGGSLTGYGGGLDAKRWLLAHELHHAVAGSVGGR